jgi:hypothetical protein
MRWKPSRPLPEGVYWGGGDVRMAGSAPLGDGGTSEKVTEVLGMVRGPPMAIWNKSRPDPLGRVLVGGSVRPAAVGCWNRFGLGATVENW